MFTLLNADVPSEKYKSKYRGFLCPDAAGVADENRQVRFPDLHSTRGKVSRELISVSSETSEEMDKFLHRGSEDAAGRHRVRVFLNGYIYRFKLGRSCNLQRGTAATE